MALRKSKLPAGPIDPGTGSPPRRPVWRGPVEDGVTQTMLSRYLTCPERFRLAYVEGWQTNPTFNARMEFGNLWHAAEEAFAADGNYASADGELHWQRAVYDYGNKLGDLYPMQRDQIIHWIQVCVALFPEYITYWKKHPDVVNRTPLLQEEKFCVPYELPSGRVVNLRGKWDSVDLVNGKGNESNGIWLQENKTKSSIDRVKITRQLKFDLQTMLYLIALESYQAPKWTRKDTPIKGVRYNVVRRGTHKTADSMLKKVKEDIAEGRGEEWFCRWNIEISPNDIRTFKTLSLDPILENLADDYEWWHYCIDPKPFFDSRVLRSATGKPTNIFDGVSRRRLFPDHVKRHFVMPYIGYNPLSEGGEADLDTLLFTGATIGLQQITHDDLFPELQ